MKVPDFAPDEPERMDALRATYTLFTPAEERFDRITRLASQLLGTPYALVTLVTDKCQWFKSAHGSDPNRHPRETSREVSFCGHAILEDDTFLVEDMALDHRFADNPLVTEDPNIRFYAGHPLHTQDGHRVGTLCVLDTKPHKFTTEQLQVLRDLAAIAENELQRGQLSDSQRLLIQERDELKLKASIDGLTQLWNRSAMDALLLAEVARAKRASPLCVAIVDADLFKNVNDRYGHQAGDAVLVELAARIRRAVRDFDAVGRYGGEEFIVLLSSCDLDSAKAVCERIRSFVAEAEINTPAGRVQVTVSIGMATLDAAQEDATLIVGEADAALYRAKARGRNRVEC